MKEFSLLLIHLLTVVAKLLGRGGTKGLIAENLLLKQQLLVVCRPRQSAPNLFPSDRFLFGLFSLFLRPGRIEKIAVGIRPSTSHLYAGHQGSIWRVELEIRDHPVFQSHL